MCEGCQALGGGRSHHDARRSATHEESKTTETQRTQSCVVVWQRALRISVPLCLRGKTHGCDRSVTGSFFFVRLRVFASSWSR